MFDALSGDLVGRAVARGGFATRSNRVTNRAGARREVQRCEDQLISFLDAHYLKPLPESDEF